MMAFDATHDGREKVKVFSQTSLAIGATDLDLTSVAQLVSKSQTRAIADVILYAKRHAKEGVSLSALLDLIEVRGFSSFPMQSTTVPVSIVYPFQLICPRFLLGPAPSSPPKLRPKTAARDACL
jgi:hypothetical protein